MSQMGMVSDVASWSPRKLRRMRFVGHDAPSSAVVLKESGKTARRRFKSISAWPNRSRLGGLLAIVLRRATGVNSQDALGILPFAAIPWQNVTLSVVKPISVLTASPVRSCQHQLPERSWLYLNRTTWRPMHDPLRDTPCTLATIPKYALVHPPILL